MSNLREYFVRAMEEPGVDSPGACGDYPARGLVQPGEFLVNGIWPRSLAVGMAAVYVALFIIRPWEQLFPWMATMRFERVYALAMIAVVLATRGFAVRFNLQTIGVALFLGAIGLSSLRAWDPGLSWEPFYVYVTLVVFYVALLSVIHTPYELVFIVACYITAMGLYLGKAQWEYCLHGAHMHDQGVVRLIGIEYTFGHPNKLAKSIAISLPMLWFLHQVRGWFCRDWPLKFQKWFTRGLFTYSVLAVWSIISTKSRSGFLSLGLAVVLLAMSGRRWGRKLWYIAVAGLLAVCLWPLLSETTRIRYQTILDSSVGPENARVSAEGREKGFWAGMKIFRQFPLAGVGPGNFEAYRFAYVDGLDKAAHNLPGQLLGETGIVGGLTFTLMVGAIFLSISRMKALSKGGENATLRVLWKFAIASRISLLLLMFEGVFGHNVYRFNWLWLAAFCGLGTEFAAQANARREPSREDPAIQPNEIGLQ